jgi:uncharacterized membrane protein YphA (DoxX/SURF4 family)
MTTIDSLIEGSLRRTAKRDARNRAAALWVLAHVGALMQVLGVLLFVSGAAVLVGAIAGVVFGLVTAMMLIGPLAFVWGFLREGGKL